MRVLKNMLYSNVIKPSLCLVVISLSLLSACQHNPTKNNTSLSDLKRLTRDASLESTNLTGIRYHALQDTALSLGARSGLQWRASQLNHILKLNERLLERIFNFYALMLPNHVLPPVLVEATHILNLNSKDTITAADRHYRILQAAKFTSLPPTWRDYLWLDFSEPELPDASLLPRNRTEQSVWKRSLEMGWQAGIHQADSIFMENIGRIKRDYSGMILYRSLLAQKIISAPFIAKTSLGITGDSQHLNVNEELYRITENAKLNPNSKSWEAEVIQHKFEHPTLPPTAQNLEKLLISNENNKSTYDKSVELPNKFDKHAQHTKQHLKINQKRS